MKNGKIQSFTDLVVWQEGHKLVIEIYKVTKLYPKEETYSLVDQMRRAASSVTANIAEGFGRHTYKEKTQFYYMAKGSLSELKNFLFISRDVSYLNEATFSELFAKLISVEQLLNKFIERSKQFSFTENTKFEDHKSINQLIDK